MAGQRKVVIKFRNGDVLKGFTEDFYKSRPTFNFVPSDSSDGMEVFCADIKAVFFVKTFEGRSEYRRLKHLPRVKVDGKPGVVHFEDGEIIEGFTQYYDAKEPFLLLIPDDPTGNNQKIFCNQKAVSRIVWESGDITFPTKKRR